MRMRLTWCALLAFIAGGTGAETVDEHWSLVDGPDGVILQQESASTIPDEYATKEVRARLQFLCAPHGSGFIARIDWHRFISSFNTEVGFSTDGTEADWRVWRIDRSNRITVSPTSEDTQLLIDSIAGGIAIEVEVSPYSEGPITVRFDVKSLPAALDALRSACE